MGKLCVNMTGPQDTQIIGQTVSQFWIKVINNINIWNGRLNKTYDALLWGASSYLLQAYTEQAELREDSVSLMGCKLKHESSALGLEMYTLGFPGFQAFALKMELTWS